MQKKSTLNKTMIYLFILIINLFYSSIIILIKLISDYPIRSFYFLFGVVLVLFLFFIYAIFWQQLLKLVSLSIAYIFKGSSVIFIMIVSYLIFNEEITLNNIIGCLFVSIGIILMFINKSNIKE